MIFDELNTGFRWYDSLDKQTRFKEYCETMCEYGLIAPCDDLLPFQIRTLSFGTPTDWILKYITGSVTTEVLNDVTFSGISFTLVSDDCIALVDITNGKNIGAADWQGSVILTLAKLVQSVNDNVSYTTCSYTPPATDNSAGYTATFDGVASISIIRPDGTGVGWDGTKILFSAIGVACSDCGEDKPFTSVTVDDATEIDISGCLTFLNRYELDGFVYLQYNGGSLPGCMAAQMPCGKWYSTISDGDNILYSEIFEVVAFTDLPFEQMKLPLFTAWRFYDDINKQNRYKEYCENSCDFYLLSGNEALPPFQIKTNVGTTGVQSWKLVGIDYDCEVILDTSLVTITNTSDGERITYNGDEMVGLMCGKFYSVLDDGVTVWYSEIIQSIEMTNDEENNYLQTDSAVDIQTDSGVYIEID